jgi:hypothetical protein
MQKIDDCKEIWLALTRAGIATCPEKCIQTFRLVVTAQYIYHRVHELAAAERDRGLLQNPKLNGSAQVLRRPKQPPRLDSLLRSEPSRRPSVCHDYREAAPPSPLRFTAFVACRVAAAFISWMVMYVSSCSMTSSR